MLLGCAPEPEAVIIDVTAAAPGATPEPQAAALGGKPKATVRDTVAYAYEGAEGPALYGAISYENTGDGALVPAKATFTFALEGKTEEVTFTPVFADQTIVLPGETAYAALWYPLAGITPGADVRLSASLEWEEASASPLRIEAGDLRLAHNYPAFTTLAGVLTPGADCPCNLIYAAFYDQAGALLGVWYFTENAHLMAGEPKAFTTHMKEFPLADLAERTAEIRAFGTGIE